MPADLAFSPLALDLATRTRRFVEDVVAPVEEASGGDIDAAGGDPLRLELQQKARDAGVFAPQVPAEYGGQGLSLVDCIPVFAAAGHSVFGPLAVNIAAPDEGNIHLLAHVADAGQRDRYLRPLACGDVRSAFAMTEPAPGAGSDPAALRCAATRVDGGWRINGRKWFITGADGAGFFIIAARTSGEPGTAGGVTLFLSPAEADGIHVGRHIETLDRSMIGGHCEVTFDDLFVGDADVLGSVDAGLAHIQVRLGPARMTHVMRWLGTAHRSHDIAVAHVAQRKAFGSTLGELGMVQKMIADNEIDLAATEALLLRGCWELDQGQRASKATSIAKTFAAEAIWRVVDRSVDMCGALGVSNDLPLARLLREVRPFRIYDGPSDVHRWAIARRALRAAGSA
ncbi:MAG: acyl-CoA dehydrogenase family protein [Mycobacterium sp.]